MSSPSSPAARRLPLDGFVGFSRASAASAACAATRARHHDDAVVVGHDDVARVDERAGADHRDVHRAQRRLDRALGVDRAGEHREGHRGEVLHVAHAAVDHEPLAPRARNEVASSSPKKPSSLSVVQAATTTSPACSCSAATCSIQLSPGCSSTVTAVPQTCAPG